MRKLVMSCAVAGLIALSPKSEARPPAYLGPLPVVLPMPQGEIGVASWYGMERQGKPTASGELFDKDRLTAAHRKLPLGSTVRVTNLKNLHSTVVRINDRGPGIEGRLIDVSWAAAKKLGFVGAGLTLVEVDIVTYPQTSPRQVTSSESPKLN
ncbi:MAG: septal ring lytic transglycosylase RlpA family protein [Terriglobia bacterium]